MNIKEFTVFNNFTSHLDGDVAEVGVYRGDSAAELLEYFPEREIYLFDTFDGIPNTVIREYDGNYEPGDHGETSLEKVKERFKDNQNIHIYPGFFPDTAKPVKDNSFVFVNIDVDIYRSTKDCWEFFYPRLCYGGVFFIQDDYPCKGTPGVKRATGEFLVDKPENLRYWPVKGVHGPVYIIKE